MKRAVVRSSLIATAAATAVALIGAGQTRAAPVYSFEVLYNNLGQPDPSGTRPDDFHVNGGDTTITQDTIGATDATHSMKFAQGPAATFTGAITEVIPPVLNAPTTYGVSFDLTVPAGGALASGFARIGISEFGSENDSPDPEHPIIDQIQTPGFAEQNINLAAGNTYKITIPFIALFNPRTFELYVPFASNFGTTPDKLTATSWEFYINKSPAVSYAVYIDNVNVVTTPISAWSTDSSGNWSDAGNWRGLPQSGGSTQFVPSAIDTLINFGGISDSSARTVTVDAPQTVGALVFNGSATFTIGGTSTLTLDVSSGQASITDNRGVHTISAPLVLNDDTTIHVASAVDSMTITALQTTTRAITKSGPGLLVSNAVRAGALNVNGGTVTIPTNGGNSGTSRVATLSFAGGTSPTASMNLSDNDLIATAGNKVTIAAQIRAARNNGAWNGQGLTSYAARDNAAHNTTLGVLSGAEFKSANGGAGATFDGFSVADADVLVKYTYYGDADFNGKVNFDDYVKTDNGFNNHLTGWFNGDYDLNGTVNFDDYVLIDLAFNTQSGTLGRALKFLDGSDRSGAGMNDAALRTMQQHLSQFGADYAEHFLAAVPEPGTLCFSGGALMGLLVRRTRRARSAE
jgi:hypothetical protein